MGSIGEVINSGQEYKVMVANYNAENETRISGNTKMAMLSSLSNFSRSLGNQVRMQAAGDQYGSAVNQLAGQLDQRSTLKLNTSLAAAQQLGSLAASAGAQGVGGSSIDLLNDVTDLQRNITQNETDRTTKQLSSSGMNDAVTNLTSGLGRIDLGTTLGNFDYSTSIAPRRLKKVGMHLFGIAAAAMIGQEGAAADAAVSQWHAANGDFNGANKAAAASASQWLQGASSGWSGGSAGGNIMDALTANRSSGSGNSDINTGSPDANANSFGGVSYGTLGSGNDTGNDTGDTTGGQTSIGNSGFSMWGW